MTIIVDIWERYEETVRGLGIPDTAEFEHMLEAPDEFDLRALVRYFDEREELLERIGRFEHDRPGDYTKEQVAGLVHAYVTSFRSVAAAFMPNEYAWTSSTEPLEIVHASADDRVPIYCDSEGLKEALFDGTYDDLSLAEDALAQVITSRHTGVGRFYLLGPLLSQEFGFEEALLLFKSGRSLWIDEGTVFLQTRPASSQWIDAPGWNPQLDWPTDAEIAERLHG